MGFIFITVRTEAYQLKATHRDKKGVPYASFSYAMPILWNEKDPLNSCIFMTPEIKKEFIINGFVIMFC